MEDEEGPIVHEGDHGTSIDDLDREEEHAIAVAVRARFGRGDLDSALLALDRLARRRLSLHASASRLCA